ncbi:MAG: 4-alpha-glucanotransferase [Verrucomicrobiota bacterium]|nr:4-alpha-glucanotransferase [Verrucomicrobiota bacterium]
MVGTRYNTNRRLAGVLVPIFSIRGENDLGIGDVDSLKVFVNFAYEVGFGFVQLIPINETGPDNSPYNAISSVAIEPMTLDCTPKGLKDLPEATASEILSKYDIETLNAGNVQYESVRKLKHELLQKAYEGFLENVYGRVDSRADDFEAFYEKEAAWLNDYCVFRLLMEREGGSQVWQNWPEDLRSKERAIEILAEEEMVSGSNELDKKLRYYAYVQWVAKSQWKETADYAASKDISLMGDIPIGVSLYSVDVWANMEIFDLDWYGGAPPEKLFKDDEFVQKWGQNWGIPLYRWDVLKERHYDWWRQRIGKATEIFGMFRVDHALGFYRIYAFPWNPVRNEEFLPLTKVEAEELCDGNLPGFKPRPDDSDEDKAANRAEGEVYLSMIKKSAGTAEMIAEDLGMVPDYVRPSLENLGIAGMKVPQWEFTDGHVTSGLQYPSCSFATYATHDHSPLPAQWKAMHKQLCEAEVESPEWWEAKKFLETLCHFAGVELEDGYRIPEFSSHIWHKLMRELCFSNSDRVAFMISDLLEDDNRINVPGVMDGTNWSYRVPASSKDLGVGLDFRDLREDIKNVLNESSRSRRVDIF